MSKNTFASKRPHCGAAALFFAAFLSLGAGGFAGDAKGYRHLKIYQPTVTTNAIYFYHPATRPALQYNHDVDIVKFRGRFFAAWNANARPAEGVPGQYNFLSTSDDFCRWSTPVRLFYKEGGCENPIETDNQWQPIFVNDHDETLYCAWCDYNARRTFVASSRDGLKWRNHEVPTAPPELAGRVVGFPTNHGLVTSKGILMLPCSLPFTPKFLVGNTRYAAVLRSEDHGRTWQWSRPIEAATWSEQGEKPQEFGGQMVAIWEPMLFEHGDGRIGLLIRNSTAQEKPEIPEKPHRMLLYAGSNDEGRSWSKARCVEVDTICSRNYAVAGVGGRDSLLMVMNDNHVQIPQRISRDRYFLSLFCAPVSNPDLLLPGPLVQPEGGMAFYPNGFVDQGKLYVAYTYPRGIHSAVVEPLPDFSEPFLLPRAGRPGLRIDGRTATLGLRQTSLGLVLNEALTNADELRLEFAVNVARYPGQDTPLLTLGGKTRSGATLRAVYSETARSDVFLLRYGAKSVEIAPLAMGRWNKVVLVIRRKEFSVAINGAAPQSFTHPLLRKICFGGLYERPEWPLGMSRPNDIRLDLDSIVVR
jgi:hypothetical protein